MVSGQWHNEGRSHEVTGLRYGSQISFHILPGPNPNPLDSSERVVTAEWIITLLATTFHPKTRGDHVQAHFTCEQNWHHGDHKQTGRSQRQSHHCIPQPIQYKETNGNVTIVCGFTTLLNRFIYSDTMQTTVCFKCLLWWARSSLIGTLWQNDVSEMSDRSCSQQLNKLIQEYIISYKIKVDIRSVELNFETQATWETFHCF